MSKNESKANAQFKLMTETPINKLIITLAIPTVISMMITMIYNVADTYFVSKINVQSSGATGIVFSLMGIVQAFGFTYGQGGGSCISRLLGAKEIEKARKYCSTSFFYALGTGLIIMAIGLIWLNPIVKLLGSTDTILPYASTYAKYVLIAAPALCTSCTMNNILRYEGMAKLAMIGLTTGGILNMILDPILIFTFNLGIAGAGLATAISQYISMGILLIIFFSGKPQTKIRIKYFVINPNVIWDITTTGIPSFARQGLNSVSTMFLNVQAGIYGGDACIAAMSIVAKVAMLIFSVGVGIGQGFQPVGSFNYGAKKYDRVRKAVLFTWRFDTIVVSALSVIIFAFAPSVVRLFRNETEIIDIGTIALRCVCASMILLPTVMTANMTFQSIGKKLRAFFLACCQNGLFFIPMIFILPKLIGITGIEISQPISNAISALIAIPFLIAFIKSLKNKKDTLY